MAGQLYIIAAPSGAGKTSLVQALVETVPDLVISVSHTTRAPRPGDVDGEDYHFISEESFQAKMAAGEFLETANVYGNYYGTSKAWVLAQLEDDKDVILEIDWQGAQLVKAWRPQAVSIYILPPSLVSLYGRLKDRDQDSPDVMTKRFLAAKTDIAHARDYDFIVINDIFRECLTVLRCIVEANRAGSPVTLGRHESLVQQLLSETMDSNPE